MVISFSLDLHMSSADFTNFFVNSSTCKHKEKERPLSTMEQGNTFGEGEEDTHFLLESFHFIFW